MFRGYKIYKNENRSSRTAELFRYFELQTASNGRSDAGHYAVARLQSAPAPTSVLFGGLPALCLLSMPALYGRALWPSSMSALLRWVPLGRPFDRALSRPSRASFCLCSQGEKSGRAADFRGSRCVYQSAQYSRDIRQSTLERPHTQPTGEGVERKSSPPDERHTRRALPKKIHTVGTHRPHTEFGSLAPHHASTT